MSSERLVPPAQNAVVLARLSGVGSRTVSAFSSAYDHEFPSALDGVVSRKEFKFCMDVINQTAEDYFPCLPCYSCGYFCCFATCGLSLLFPEPCTRELEANLEVVLKRLNNRDEFLYRGIVWKLRRDKRTRTSWLELCQIVYE